MKGLPGDANCDESEDGEEDHCPLSPTPALSIHDKTSDHRPAYVVSQIGHLCFAWKESLP